MFPLLPAILILLLQGPSNFERLAAHGRMPASMEAICRGVGETPTLREAEEAVLASLLAAGEDPDYSDALLALLLSERVRRIEPVEAIAEQVRRVTPEWAAPPLRAGFGRGQRSRDGPASIA